MTTPPDPLTRRQRRVLRAVLDHTLRHAVPPTLREVCAAFGWASTNSAMCHVKALIRKGYLTHTPGRALNYRLAGVRAAVDDTEAGRRLREATGDEQG